MNQRKAPTSEKRNNDSDNRGKLTTKTKILFRVAQTRTNMPAPRMMVAAIFFKSFNLDSQSRGMGINMRYISVETFAANEAQIIGLDTAA